MRDKIFNEILKIYPSCHDLLSKRILTDKILNLPVDGVQVTTTCFDCDGKKEYIHNGFTGDFDSNGQPIVDEELKGKLVPCDCVDGKMVRPLTIGEALKMLPNMVEALKAAEPCLKDWIETTGFGKVCRRDKNALALSTKSLTTKDGGIVEVNDEK